MRASGVAASFSTRAAIASAKSCETSLLSSTKACVGTTDASRRSHVRSGFAPLNVSTIGSIKLRCWNV
ncbi:MAG: hypothetical protein R2724_19650 [Bryobacterales bacterium]